MLLHECTQVLVGREANVVPTIAATSHSPMGTCELANQRAGGETSLAPTHHELRSAVGVVMTLMRGATCAPWFLAGGAVFRDQNGGL